MSDDKVSLSALIAAIAIFIAFTAFQLWLLVGAPSDPEQRFPLIPSTPIPTDPEQHSD